MQFGGMELGRGEGAASRPLEAGAALASQRTPRGPCCPLHVYFYQRMEHDTFLDCHAELPVYPLPGTLIPAGLQAQASAAL